MGSEGPPSSAGAAISGTARDARGLSKADVNVLHVLPLVDTAGTQKHLGTVEELHCLGNDKNQL